MGNNRKEVRIGLIGGGWMGRAHTTSFHNAGMIFGDQLPVFEVVSDVNEELAAIFAKANGYRRYTDDW
jgi:predicted dehydrogenase